MRRPSAKNKERLNLDIGAPEASPILAALKGEALTAGQICETGRLIGEKPRRLRHEKRLVRIGWLKLIAPEAVSSVERSSEERLILNS